MSPTLQRNGNRKMNPNSAVPDAPIDFAPPADGQPSKRQIVRNRLSQARPAGKESPKVSTAQRATQSTYHSSQAHVSKDLHKLQEASETSHLPVHLPSVNKEVICLSDREESEPIISPERVLNFKSNFAIKGERKDPTRKRKKITRKWGPIITKLEPLMPSDANLKFSTSPAVGSTNRKANSISARYQGQQGPKVEDSDTFVGYWVPHREEDATSGTRPEDKGMVVPGDVDFPEYGGFEIGPEHDDVVYHGPRFWRFRDKK
jgi:hypothetical protein